MTDLAVTGLSLVSLFAGIGGIDLAFQRAGVPSVLAVEINRASRGVLADHWPDLTLVDDVRGVTGDRLRQHADPARAILAAGWPCQGFSLAGKRQGLDDHRSGLWTEVARLLAEYRPRWFVGENVPGLLSLHRGRDFARVLLDLAQLGYGFAWRILDAQYFGVPQRRRRIVLVGHSSGDPRIAARILLEPESVPGDIAPGGPAGPDHPGAAAGRPGGDRPVWQCHGGNVGPAGTLRAGNGHMTGGVPFLAHTLTAEGADASEDGTGRGVPLIATTLTAHHHRGSDEDLGRLVVSTLTGSSGGPDDNTAQASHLVAFQPQAGGDTGLSVGPTGAETLVARQRAAVAVAENQRGEVRTSGTAVNLTTGGGKPGQGYPAVLHGSFVRRLTPVECERLQGLPDGWTATSWGRPQKDSPRYRQIGDAVAVPVFEWVARRLAHTDARRRVGGPE